MECPCMHLSAYCVLGTILSVLEQNRQRRGLLSWSLHFSDTLLCYRKMIHASVCLLHSAVSFCTKGPLSWSSLISQGYLPFLRAHRKGTVSIFWTTLQVRHREKQKHRATLAWVWKHGRARYEPQLHHWLAWWPSSKLLYLSDPVSPSVKMEILVICSSQGWGEG